MFQSLPVVSELFSTNLSIRAMTNDLFMNFIGKEPLNFIKVRQLKRCTCMQDHPTSDLSNLQLTATNTDVQI